MARIIDERTFRAEQAEIHAPCVDGNAVKTIDSATSLLQAITNLVKDAESIPIKTGRQVHRRVLETMKLFEF